MEPLFCYSEPGTNGRSEASSTDTNRTSSQLAVFAYVHSSTVSGDTLWMSFALALHLQKYRHATRK
jgi:hypothetical protein